ncbi:RNA polymerase sigma factor [Bacteroidota bacterium]
MTKKEIMNDSDRQKEFLKYFEPARESLSRFARAMCKNNEDSKDLIADTILAAYENFGKIKNKQAFLSYLFTTASRIYKRKIWRNRIFGLFDETKAENLENKDSSAEVKFDILVLNEALEKLPQKQKEAIAFFELSGLTLEEIRKIQGGTISGVKSRLKRGRQKLIELLKDNTINEIDIDLQSKSNGTIAHYNSNEVLLNMKVQK